MKPLTNLTVLRAPLKLNKRPIKNQLALYWSFIQFLYFTTKTKRSRLIKTKPLDIYRKTSDAPLGIGENVAPFFLRVFIRSTRRFRIL